MQIIFQKRHQCLITAATMVLNALRRKDIMLWPDNLNDELGHSWKEKIHPELPEPKCYRGYHLQEIIFLFLKYGYGLLYWEFEPKTSGGVNIWSKELGEKIFTTLIKNRIALLGVETKNGGHMVAWDGTQIFDPSKGIYPYHNDTVLEYKNALIPTRVSDCFQNEIESSWNIIQKSKV